MTSCTGKMFLYDFHIDSFDDVKGATSMRLYGMNAKRKTICLQISDFCPYVYIALPPLPGRMKWDKNLAKKVFGDAWLKQKLSERRVNNVGIRFVKRKKLYSPQITSTGVDNKFPFLQCRFATRIGIYALKKLLYSPVLIPSIFSKKMYFKIHESNADEILQLVCNTGIPTAGWINYTGIKARSPATSADREVKVSYENISPLACADPVDPLVMSFDIEAYSHQVGKFPDAKHPDDQIFMISCVFFRNSSKKFEREVLLTLGNPKDDVVGAECIRFKIEAELIEGFSKLVREMNPHIITGWNILGFDIEYMIERSIQLAAFRTLSITGMHNSRGATKTKTIKWKSAAYSTQEFQYLPWEGRILVDLLPVIRRDHKLSNYKLDTVSKHFLGGAGKDDLPVEQLFECYDVGIKDKNSVNTPIARQKVSIAGKYCMVDSRLVAHLFTKTDTWIGLTEMAATCNVPIFDIVVRGQQKRVFSQVYKFCKINGIVVEQDGYKAEENERYVGAYVFTPKAGVYDNIVPFDFASLYPTTIIAYNIDYSTLVKNKRVPNHKCHVIEWEDHLGCEHDPKVKRVKSLTALIDAKEKEMKSLRSKRDKLRIVEFIPNYTSGKKYDKSLRRGAKVMRDREKRKINKQLEIMKKNIKPYREERADVKKGIPKMRMCSKRKYRFLKEPKGVIPTVLQNLLDSRKQTRVEKKNLEKTVDSLPETERQNAKVLINVLEQRQKAKKVCANSVGATTPIPCKHKGKFVYKTIEEISKGDWKRINDEQEVSLPIDDLFVWSDKGFTKPNFVMRHPQDSPLVRVITHTGMVEATNDHSLLKPCGEEVKPRDLSVGDRLMHHPVPLPNDTPCKPFLCTITDDIIRNYELCTSEEKMAFVDGLFMAEGTCATWGVRQKAKSSWIIYNSDKSLLDRACKLLNRFVPSTKNTFKVVLYPSNANQKGKKDMYHLVAQGSVKALCEEYRPRLYDSRGHKRVPDYVLTSSLSTRKAFFIGYYSGDGARLKKIGVVLQQKGHRCNAQLIYLARSLGYKISVDYNEKANNLISRIQCSLHLRLSKKKTSIKRMYTAPLPDPIKDLTPVEIMNNQPIKLNGGRSEYRRITLVCSRLPRQKLLDSLDDAIEKAARIRNCYATDYNTKTKKITLVKYCCGITHCALLRNVKKEMPCAYKRQGWCDCVCVCEKKYNDVPVYQKTQSVEYVYDIETENHHFAAGVGNIIVHNSMYGAMGVREGYLPFMPGAMCTTAMGRRNNKLAAKTIVDKWDGELVYGDTDSEYIFFPHIKGDTREETAALLWDHCLKVAADVTKLYPAPMKLEFEEEIYHRFLILSKKRYMYKMMKRDGIVQEKVGNKGVLLSRRDNSDVVRDVYGGLVMRIFNRVGVDEILDWIFEQVLMMFQRTVAIEKLTITKKIGGVGTLPLLHDSAGITKDWVREIETGCGNESDEMKEKLDAGKVVVGDYTIPKLSHEPKERARQLSLKHAKNAIEYYTHSLPAHVALAMKMRARGVRVDNGTRLEHLVTLSGGHGDKLFSKVEDVNYFRRHSQYLNVDFLHYLKAMTTPIDQVLNACFGKNPVAKNFMTRLYKHWVKREKVVESIAPPLSIVFKN